MTIDECHYEPMQFYGSKQASCGGSVARHPTVNLKVSSSAPPGDKHFICVIRHPVGNLKNFEYFLIYSNRASQRVSSST